MKLNIYNLNFEYYKGYKILENINLEINNEEIVCILGRNGSGKTTLIKCINRLLENYSGNITIDGHNIKKLRKIELAQNIAYIPQLHRIVFNFEVIDFVVMGRYPHMGFFSNPSDDDYEIAYRNLKELGIEHFYSKNFNELSGGEKQIVLVAKAITQEPKMFMLDEPTNHLDFKNQHSILKLIRKIAKRKRINVLLTMHNPNLAYRYCDRFIMLKEGQIYKSGRREDVFKENILNKIYDMELAINSLDEDGKVITPKNS
ncbi:MAG: ABC transporter ATP-binding protein [Spirochaetota bacterium]